MSLFDVEENTLNASIELAKQEIWRIYNEADEQRNRIVSALIDSHMNSINVPRGGAAEQAYHILLREAKIFDALPPQYESLRSQIESYEREIEVMKVTIQDLRNQMAFFRKDFNTIVK